MNKNFAILEKTKLIVAACSGTLIIFMALNFTGVLEKIGGPKTSEQLGYLGNYASTGMANSPAVETLAMNDSDQNPKYASTQKNSDLAQNIPSKELNANGMQVVLFDITARSIVTNIISSSNLLWILSGIAGLGILYLLLKGSLKNKKIEKIKQVTHIR